MKKYSVLIAEDDNDDWELTREAFLSSNLYDAIVRVENGEELISYLNKNKNKSFFPDFILSDLNMPRLNGLQALSQIKNDPALSDTPVIIYTSSHSKQEEKLSYNHGAHLFISKPACFMEIVKIAVRLPLVVCENPGDLMKHNEYGSF